MKELSQSSGKAGGAKVFDNGKLRVWGVVMLVYILVFSYTGYIAFWPMAFNDPDNTVKKYLEIIDAYEEKRITDVQHDFKPTMEELMKKSEAEANSMQQLASQSFNIVLGAFLAFLSATVTMIFQSKDPEPSPTPD